MDEKNNVTTVPAYQKDALDEKIVTAFPGKIVRKDLTAQMKQGFGVPTFVLEYLLGMYCATDDEAAVAEGLERIRKILTENFVRPDESEAVKSRIRERGRHTVIDRLSAVLDEREDIYVGRLASLGIDPFVVPDKYAREYTKMLMGGIWCIIGIEYVHDQVDGSSRKGKKRGPQDLPFRIVSITPIQMPNLDLEELISHRGAFTDEEWEALLLRSAGYEPSELSERERMHFLERMVPLVERNYNLCELGPRGTGKSHLYTEVSPHAYLLSGGQTTTAKLFADLRGVGKSSMGLVGYWDCIAFDEVAGMRFKATDAINIMKGYMANGSFGRGTSSYTAEASMVFEGNINESPAAVLKTTHLFDPFPPEFNNDSAFFDRIHCYLPGWEVPKMRSDLLTGRYALITDCLSEFCHAMRRRDYSHLFDEWFRLNNDFNVRDEIGVRKTFSGLAKLMYPTGELGKEQARALLEYAIEGRRRVKEQLKIMAGVEFNDVDLGYFDVDEPQVPHIMTVPEQSSSRLIGDVAMPAGFAYGIGRALGGEWSVYRLENKAVAGSMGFQMEGIGRVRSVKESFQAAFSQFRDNVASVAPGMRAGEKDYLMFLNDLQGHGPSDEISLAEFVGLCSAACGRPIEAGLAIPGIVRLSGTMDELTGLTDLFRVAKNAGARRILLPMGAIRSLMDVPGELAGAVSPEFYADGDFVEAARKALDL